MDDLFSLSAVRKQTLRKIDFSQADLRQCDFRATIFEECSLRDANMTGSRFDGADLWGVDLSGLRLIDASLFRGATVSREQAGQLRSELPNNQTGPLDGGRPPSTVFRMTLKSRSAVPAASRRNFRSEATTRHFTPKLRI